jgi:predicted CoA-binding protein
VALGASSEPASPTLVPIKLDEKGMEMSDRLPDETLAEIYRNTATIAVVGASTDPDKPAHHIPAYLQAQGFRIIPVNPIADMILGERAVDSLDDISQPVDVVNVFRPAQEAPELARQAVELGASTLWLQLGIESDEAAAIAKAHGLAVVMDTCMGATHKRLDKAGRLSDSTG